MLKRSLIIKTAIIFAMLLTCGGAGIYGMAEVPGLGVGVQAPEFRLHDLDGNLIKLSDLRGKVVFLNFWATYCVPCKEEMPSMQALNERFKGSDFVMLAVSIDKNKQDTADFIKDKKFDFIVISDPDKKCLRTYKVTGLPTTFIIDKSGIIQFKSAGPQDWDNAETVKMIGGLIK